MGTTLIRALMASGQLVITHKGCACGSGRVGVSLPGCRVADGQVEKGTGKEGQSEKPIGLRRRKIYSGRKHITWQSDLLLQCEIRNAAMCIGRSLPVSLLPGALGLAL